MSSWHKTLKLHGTCVFWTLPEILDQALVEDAFQQSGMHALTPAQLRPKTAMRRALKEHFPKDFRVEDVSTIDGFHVLEKLEDENGKLSFPHRLTAFAVAIAGSPDLTVLGRDESPEIPLTSDACQEQITDRYKELRRSVTGSALGRSLSDAVSYLRGIPLRPTGGFYWIPEAAIPAWETLADGLKPAGSQLYSLTTGVDARSVETLCAALEAKVKSELSQLQSALYDREPGPRGLRTLQRRALDVDSLIEEYQRLLGKTHSEIAKEAQEMEAEITVALMAAEADA